MLYISSFHYSYWHTVSQVSVMGKQGLMMCKYVLGGLACFVVEEKRKGQQKASHTSTGVLWCQLSLCGNLFGWCLFINSFSIPVSACSGYNKGAGAYPMCLSEKGPCKWLVHHWLVLQAISKSIANMTRY